MEQDLPEPGKRGKRNLKVMASFLVKDMEETWCEQRSGEMSDQPSTMAHSRATRDAKPSAVQKLVQEEAREPLLDAQPSCAAGFVRPRPFLASESLWHTLFVCDRAQMLGRSTLRPCKNDPSESRRAPNRPRHPASETLRGSHRGVGHRLHVVQGAAAVESTHDALLRSGRADPFKIV